MSEFDIKEILKATQDMMKQLEQDGPKVIETINGIDYVKFDYLQHLIEPVAKAGLETMVYKRLFKLGKDIADSLRIIADRDTLDKGDNYQGEFEYEESK